MRNIVDIDFVVTWVNNEDKEWIDSYNFYKKKQSNINFNENDESRFRDWSIFNFWFRSVELYCPWVRKIHLVTCDHYPNWLNLNHPKINLVKHKDIIPNEFLPTFNSQVIELFLHNINGLSEHFVYFNDDMFVNSELDEKHFFRDGLPCDTLFMEPLFQIGNENLWSKVRHNGVSIVNKYFNKKEVGYKNLGKFFNTSYNFEILLKNFFQFPYGFFSSFHDYHLSQPLLKSSFKDVCFLEEDYLKKCSMNKFRTSNEVNQYLFRYWHLVQGKFSVIDKSKSGYALFLDENNYYKLPGILNSKYREICINDGENTKNFKFLQSYVLQEFRNKFPEKSKFEVF